MAIIKPFKALRPLTQTAPIVSSVPYDVVNREESKELAEGNPLSFLRVTRSEIEFDNSVSPYSPEIYKKAKENLEKLKKAAPLRMDEKSLLPFYKSPVNRG